MQASSCIHQLSVATIKELDSKIIFSKNQTGSITIKFLILSSNQNLIILFLVLG
jgi:hypothetical protein